MSFEPGFESDPEKDRKNVQKHGFSVEEAATVFRDPLNVDVPDPDHSNQEERRVIVGLTDRGRLVVVWYTERAEKTRIIGSRKPTRSERKKYENGRR